MINGLDLFSGIGGIAYALREWVRPVAYCEIDSYAQGVLLSRMESGDLAVAPIWNDITTLDGHRFKGQVDIISGGFPCQDISVAGAGAGLGGKRSGLFFEIMRLVDEIQPTFIFLENVPAIRTRGLGEVTAEITRRGYDSRWTMLSAAEVGAPHIRKRWWLLAHSRSERRQQISRSSHGYESQNEGWPEKEMHTSECDGQGGGARDVAHTSGKGPQGRGLPIRTQTEQSGTRGSCWWAAEPDVGRVANGIPNRVDRIKGLGNAVVPLQAKQAFKELMGITI